MPVTSSRVNLSRETHLITFQKPKSKSYKVCNLPYCTSGANGNNVAGIIMTISPVIEKCPHKSSNTFLVTRPKSMKFVNLIKVSTFNIIHSHRVCFLHSLNEILPSMK